VNLPVERRAERRKRRPRKGPPQAPYALIHAAALVFAACCLPPAAIRVLLLAHAAWRPDPSGKKPGRAVLGYGMIHRPKPVDKTQRRPFAYAPAPGRTGIKAALDALQAIALMIQTAPGTRPKTPGGACGKAAEWQVPARDGTYPQRLPWPQDLRRPDGGVRLPVEVIRRDCAELTINALRVLMLAVGLRDRLASGALADELPLELRLSWLGEHLGLPPASASDALSELIKAKRLMRVQDAKGRAPALYELDDRYRRALKRQRAGRAH